MDGGPRPACSSWSSWDGGDRDVETFVQSVWTVSAEVQKRIFSSLSGVFKHIFWVFELNFTKPA